jgi:solute carrier family 25 carnitine/acylcarnitine transporter 20/29
VAPIELVKVRLQIQNESKANAYYKGVLDCINKTFKENGIKGLYKGTVATILREVPAYAGQFGGYYYAKKFMANYRKKEIVQLGNLDLMICGAIGGYFCWQFSYPQDVIKTVLQVNYDGFKSRFYDGGFFECGKLIYANQGFMGFWRGYLPCTIRALVANSVLFAAYENSKAILKNLYK